MSCNRASWLAMALPGLWVIAGCGGPAPEPPAARAPVSAAGSAVVLPAPIRFESEPPRVRLIRVRPVPFADTIGGLPPGRPVAYVEETQSVLRTTSGLPADDTSTTTPSPAVKTPADSSIVFRRATPGPSEPKPQPVERLKIDAVSPSNANVAPDAVVQKPVEKRAVSEKQNPVTSSPGPKNELHFSLDTPAPVHRRRLRLRRCLNRGRNSRRAKQRRSSFAIPPRRLQSWPSSTLQQAQGPPRLSSKHPLNCTLPPRRRSRSSSALRQAQGPPRLSRKHPLNCTLPPRRRNRPSRTLRQTQLSPRSSAMHPLSCTLPSHRRNLRTSRSALSRRLPLRCASHRSPPNRLSNRRCSERSSSRRASNRKSAQHRRFIMPSWPTARSNRSGLVLAVPTGHPSCWQFANERR